MAAKQPDPKRETYLGMREGDLDDKWYAKYWNPHMGALPTHVTDALNVSPVSPQLAMKFEDIGTITDPGYQLLENGYTVLDDSAMHLAVRTNMPNVTPTMWDWWFWWHATETERYKLWYPSAHLYAEWGGSPEFTEETPYRDRYINGDSYVDEYVGYAPGELVIQFRSPTELGLDQEAIDAAGATAICGIVGLSNLPLDWGYLLHYVRPTQFGSEMRSRFWMGGDYVRVRPGKKLPKAAAGAKEALQKMGTDEARSMVIHCAREMNHLATFLPYIYAEYHGLPSA